MSQTLSWNLHGNDQLSAVLERLDRTLSGLSRKLDATTADARQMGTALGAAESPARRLGSAADHTGQRLDSLSGRVEALMARLKTLGVVIATVAAAAGVSLAFMAVKTASANEQAAISFELMLGSAQKAQKFLGELQAFAAATPFEMPQLRTAASRLLAVGTNIKDIIPLLTALGDATAGMGTGAFGIERAVTALTQMQQKTKVTAEEMMQLTEAGIPAWATLAAFLKTDVATAMKMVEKRTVDATVIFQAIETKAGPAMQRLSGMMARQATTLEGVWSTFKDNAGQALAKFAEPMLPALKRMVDVAGQVVPKILDKIRSMGSQVAAIFGGSDVPGRIFNSLREMGEKVLPVLERSWNRILKTVSDNKEGLEKLGRFVADVLIPFLGGTLITTIEAVTLAFQGIIWISARIVDAIQGMTLLVLNSLGLIVHGAKAAWDWVPGLGPKLDEAADKFDSWAQGILDKLGQLNGAAASFSGKLVASIGAGAAGGAAPRAVGGPVWAGGVYDMNELGPERYYAATTGTVQPYSQGGGTSGEQFLGTVKFQLDLDGRMVHEKLLNFKANSGKISLDLG